MPYNYVRRGYKRNWRKLRKVVNPVSKRVYQLGMNTSVNGYSINGLKKALGLNTEKKYISYETTGTSGITIATGTPVIELLNDIQVGDAYNQMNGHSVRLTSLQMRGYVKSDPDSTIPVHARIMIVRWDDEDTPTIQDILENFGSGTDTKGIHRPYVKGQNKMRVLWDQTYKLDASSADGYYAVHDFFIRLKLDFHMKRAVINGVGTDVFNMGRLYMVGVTDIDTAGQLPVISCVARTNFVDN